MKRTIRLFLALGILLSLCACGQKDVTSAWQEQYDLGVRYLSEGNYEQAILAFEAAIEIDPNLTEAYLGRADAYLGSGETDANLAAALADFEKAIELDETDADAWLGLADVYIRQGDFDKAVEVLKDGLEKCSGDALIANKIAEMEQGNISDRSGKTWKSSHFENGELIQYWLYDYDEQGRNTRTTCYNADGTLQRTETSEFNQQGQQIRSVDEDVDGNTTVTTYEYDILGRCIKETRETADPNEPEWSHVNYTLISYSEDARTETHDEYSEDGTLQHRFVIEYDDDGIRQRGTNYRPDENGELYLDYYVEYIWNEDGSYGGFNHVQVASDEEYSTQDE